MGGSNNHATKPCFSLLTRNIPQHPFFMVDKTSLNIRWRYRAAPSSAFSTMMGDEPHPASRKGQQMPACPTIAWCQGKGIPPTHDDEAPPQPWRCSYSLNQQVLTTDFDNL